jgi:hypothetical protein
MEFYDAQRSQSVYETVAPQEVQWVWVPLLLKVSSVSPTQGPMCPPSDIPPTTGIPVPVSPYLPSNHDYSSHQVSSSLPQGYPAPLQTPASFAHQPGPFDEAVVDLTLFPQSPLSVDPLGFGQDASPPFTSEPTFPDPWDHSTPASSHYASTDGHHSPSPGVSFGVDLMELTLPADPLHLYPEPSSMPQALDLRYGRPNDNRLRFHF